VPHGGIFTVILSATTRTLTVEWLNPRGGAITAVGTTVAGPANESFIPPFSGDAAPYLVDAAGHNWVSWPRADFALPVRARLVAHS
jgi:hypothetical protein